MASLNWYFSRWQVLGSNQRRLSRRFTDRWRKCCDLRGCQGRLPFGHVLDVIMLPARGVFTTGATATELPSARTRRQPGRRPGMSIVTLPPYWSSIRGSRLQASDFHSGYAEAGQDPAPG